MAGSLGAMYFEVGTHVDYSSLESLEKRLSSIAKDYTVNIKAYFDFGGLDVGLSKAETSIEKIEQIQKAVRDIGDHFNKRATTVSREAKAVVKDLSDFADGAAVNDSGIRDLITRLDTLRAKYELLSTSISSFNRDRLGGDNNAVSFLKSEAENLAQILASIPDIRSVLNSAIGGTPKQIDAARNAMAEMFDPKFWSAARNAGANFGLKGLIDRIELTVAKMDKLNRTPFGISGKMLADQVKDLAKFDVRLPKPLFIDRIKVTARALADMSDEIRKNAAENFEKKPVQLKLKAAKIDTLSIASEAIRALEDKIRDTITAHFKKDPIVIHVTTDGENVTLARRRKKKSGDESEPETKSEPETRSEPAPAEEPAPKKRGRKPKQKQPVTEPAPEPVVEEAPEKEDVRTLKEARSIISNIAADSTDKATQLAKANEIIYENLRALSQAKINLTGKMMSASSDKERASLEREMQLVDDSMRSIAGVSKSISSEPEALHEKRGGLVRKLKDAEDIVDRMKNFFGEDLTSVAEAVEAPSGGGAAGGNNALYNKLKEAARNTIANANKVFAEAFDAIDSDKTSEDLLTSNKSFIGGAREIFSVLRGKGVEGVDGAMKTSIGEYDKIAKDLERTLKLAEDSKQPMGDALVSELQPKLMSLAEFVDKLAPLFGVESQIERHAEGGEARGRTGTYNIEAALVNLFAKQTMSPRGGGQVNGIGTATSDSNPAMLSKGEYVINAFSNEIYRPINNLINGVKGGVTEVEQLEAALVGLSDAHPDVKTFSDALNTVRSGADLSAEQLEALDVQLRRILGLRVERHVRGGEAGSIDSQYREALGFGKNFFESMMRGALEGTADETVSLFLDNVKQAIISGNNVGKDTIGAIANMSGIGDKKDTIVEALNSKENAEAQEVFDAAIREAEARAKAAAEAAAEATSTTEATEAAREHTEAVAEDAKATEEAAEKKKESAASVASSTKKELTAADFAELAKALDMADDSKNAEKEAIALAKAIGTVNKQIMAIDKVDGGNLGSIRAAWETLLGTLKEAQGDEEKTSLALEGLTLQIQKMKNATDTAIGSVKAANAQRKKDYTDLIALATKRKKSLEDEVRQAKANGESHTFIDAEVAKIKQYIDLLRRFRSSSEDVKQRILDGSTNYFAARDTDIRNARVNDAKETEELRRQAAALAEEEALQERLNQISKEAYMLGKQQRTKAGAMNTEETEAQRTAINYEKLEGAMQRVYDVGKKISIQGESKAFAGPGTESAFERVKKLHEELFALKVAFEEGSISVDQFNGEMARLLGSGRTSVSTILSKSVSEVNRQGMYNKLAEERKKAEDKAKKKAEEDAKKEAAKTETETAEKTKKDTAIGGVPPKNVLEEFVFAMENVRRAKEALEKRNPEATAAIEEYEKLLKIMEALKSVGDTKLMERYMKVPLELGENGEISGPNLKEALKRAQALVPTKSVDYLDKMRTVYSDLSNMLNVVNAKQRRGGLLGEGAAEAKKAIEELLHSIKAVIESEDQLQAKDFFKNMGGASGASRLKSQFRGVFGIEGMLDEDAKRRTDADTKLEVKLDELYRLEEKLKKDTVTVNGERASVDQSAAVAELQKRIELAEKLQKIEDENQRAAAIKVAMDRKSLEGGIGAERANELAKEAREATREAVREAQRVAKEAKKKEKKDDPEREAERQRRRAEKKADQAERDAAKRANERAAAQERLNDLYRRCGAAITAIQAKIETASKEEKPQLEGRKRQLEAINGELDKIREKDGGVGAGAAKTFGDAIDEAAGFKKNVREGTDALREMARHAGGLQGLFGNIFSVYTIKRFFEQLVNIGGEFEKQHVALTSMLGDAAKADEIFSRMKGLAVESPFTFQQLTSFTKQLTAYSIPYEELYETTKRLADISAGLGVDMSRIILAYGQVRSAEFLRGQEVRQFTEAGIPLLDRLAKKFTALEGRVVSVGEVFKRISKRQVPFAMVKDVMWGLTDEGGQFYNMQSELTDTLSGSAAKMKDMYQIMLSEIADDWGGVVRSFISGISSIIQHWKTFSGIVVGGAVFGTFRALSGLIAGIIVKFKEWSAAIKAVGAASTALKLTSALALVAGVVAGLITYYKQWNALSREMEEIHAEAESNIASEALGLRTLIERIKHTNAGTLERQELITKLNERYGDYLDNLVNESMTYEQIAASADKATLAIIRKYRAQELQKKQQAIYDDNSEDLNDARKAIQRGLMESLGMGKKQASQYATTIENMILGGMSRTELNDILKNTLGKAIDEIVTTSLQFTINGDAKTILNQPVDDYYEKLGEIQKLQDELIGEENFDKLNVQYNDAIKAVRQEYEGDHGLIALQETREAALEKELEMWREIYRIATGLEYGAKTPEVKWPQPQPKPNGGELDFGKVDVHDFWQTYPGANFNQSLVDWSLSNHAERQVAPFLMPGMANEAVNNIEAIEKKMQEYVRFSRTHFTPSVINQKGTQYHDLVASSTEDIANVDTYLKNLATVAENLETSIEIAKKTKEGFVNSGHEAPNESDIKENEDKFQRIIEYFEHFGLNWKDYLKSSKKDKGGEKELLKRIREQFDLFKKVEDSYKKNMSAGNGISESWSQARKSDAFATLLSQGLVRRDADVTSFLNSAEAFKKSVRAMLSANDPDDRNLREQIDNWIESFELEEASRKIEKQFKVLTTQLDDIAKQWEYYKTLIAAGFERGTAITMSFDTARVAENAKTITDYLRKRLEENLAGTGITNWRNLRNLDEGEVADALYGIGYGIDKDLLENPKTHAAAAKAYEERKANVKAVIELVKRLYSEEEKERSEVQAAVKDSVQFLEANVRYGMQRNAIIAEYNRLTEKAKTGEEKRLLNLRKMSALMKVDVDEWKNNPLNTFAMSNLSELSKSALDNLVVSLGNVMKGYNLPESSEQMKAVRELQQKMYGEYMSRSLVPNVTQAAEAAKVAQNDLRAAKNRLAVAKAYFETTDKSEAEERKVQEAVEGVERAEWNLYYAQQRLLESVKALKETFGSIGKILSDIGGIIDDDFGKVLSSLGSTFSAIPSIADSIGKGGWSAVSGYVQGVVALYQLSNTLSDAVSNMNYAAYERAAEKRREINAMRDAVYEYAQAVAEAHAEERNWFGSTSLMNLRDYADQYANAVKAYSSKLYESQEIYQNKKHGGWGNYFVAGLITAAGVLGAAFTAGTSVAVAVNAAAGYLAVSGTVVAGAMAGAAGAIGAGLAAGGEAIYNSFKYAEGQTAAINNLMIETRSKSNGFWGTGWGGHDQQTQSLQSWLAEIEVIYNAYMDYLAGMSDQKNYEKIAKAQGYGWEQQKTFAEEMAKMGLDNFQLFDDAGNLNLELAKAILENEELSDKLQGDTKDTLEALIEYQEKMDEYHDKLKEVVSDTYSPLLEAMTDAIWDWFDNGVNALTSFKKNAIDVFRDIATQMMQTLLLEHIFDQFENQIFGLYDQYSMSKLTDNPMTERELGQSMATIAGGLVEAFGSAVPFLENFMMGLDSQLKNNGYDYGLGDKNTSGTSKSISGMTEETADILAAYMNGMRTDLAGQRNAVEYIAYSGLAALAGEIQESMGNSASMLEAAEATAYDELPALNATAEAQLRQLNQQTEYLNQIRQSNDAIREDVYQLQTDLHSVIYGSNKIRV